MNSLVSQFESLVYEGDLDVEDGIFTLHADRLILNKNSISFKFSGSSEDGKFKIDGMAMQTGQWSYASNRLNLTYLQFKSESWATIQFDEISV